jgi:uncharacterized membrane protein
MQDALDPRTKNIYPKEQIKMAKQPEQLVLGFFPSEEAAKKAAQELEGFDRSVAGIKFDNIGILTKDKKGKVKAEMQGPRHTGAGLLLGALAGVLTGGISILAGALLGGVLGHFVHKSLGLSKDDLTRISGELDGGKAAVGILVPESEAKAVTSWMEGVGGKTEAHAVAEDAEQQATAVIAQSPELAAPDKDIIPPQDANPPGTEMNAPTA